MQLSCNYLKSNVFLHPYFSNETFMFLSVKKSDFVGALSSALCLAHCLATPLLFIAQTQTIGDHHDKPLWWSSLDIVFLIISFFAIYKTAKTSTKKWVKQLLWANWALLTFIILNEKVHLIPLPESVVYIPSVALIILHIYNSRYCQCKDETCCTNG